MERRNPWDRDYRKRCNALSARDIGVCVRKCVGYSFKLDFRGFANFNVHCLDNLPCGKRGSRKENFKKI